VLLVTCAVKSLISISQIRMNQNTLNNETENKIFCQPRVAEMHLSYKMTHLLSRERRWVVKKRNTMVLVHFMGYCFHFTIGNQCLQYCNSLKSGFLHLTSQPYCKKSRSAKVKDGIINLILRTISLIDTSYINDTYLSSKKVVEKKIFYL